MATLWVVRHGQASLHSANYDRLSELGRQQSRALGRHFASAGVGFDRVLTGPAERQRDTATLAGEELTAAGRAWPEPTILPGLDEHDAFALVSGAVEALQDDAEIAELHAAIGAADARAEQSRAFQRLFEAVMARWLRGELSGDAETWPQFAARVDAAIDAIVAMPGTRLVAFSSVGPMAVMLRRALGTSDLRSFQTAWRIRNASISRFEFGRGRFSLDGFNALPHLPDPATWTFR